MLFIYSNMAQSDRNFNKGDLFLISKCVSVTLFAVSNSFQSLRAQSMLFKLDETGEHNGNEISKMKKE